MSARGALVAFGFLLTVMGVVLVVAGPDRGDRSGVLLLSGMMIVVAIGVTALAALAKPRGEDDLDR